MSGRGKGAAHRRRTGPARWRGLRTGVKGERQSLLIALGISLLAHGLMLGLTFGGQEFGLPGFDLPWRERRVAAPDLHVVLAPAPKPTPAEPPPPQASPQPPRIEQLTLPPRVVVQEPEPAPPVPEPADADAVPEQVQVMTERTLGDMGGRHAAPHAHLALMSLKEPGQGRWVSPVVPEVPSRAIAMAPSASSPVHTPPPIPVPTPDPALELARVARLQAERLEAARSEAALQEALRQQAARRDEERQEAQRKEAARLAAERTEAQRQDEARQLAARLEAERQEQAQKLAAQEAAARQRAAQIEADEARREAARRAMGRQLDEEAARRDAAASRSAGSSPPSGSNTRRGRLLGRADPNAELVLYAEAWARRIQLNVAIEALRELVSRPHANPIVTVALRRDGTVESIVFVISSGVTELDEAIRSIVQAQAPFQAFTPGLAGEYDVIEIRRTWYFDSAIRLY